MDYADCVMLHLHLKHNYFNTIFKTQNKSITASGPTAVSSTSLKLKIMGMQMHSPLLCEFKLKKSKQKKNCDTRNTDNKLCQTKYHKRKQTQSYTPTKSNKNIEKTTIHPNTVN